MRYEIPKPAYLRKGPTRMSAREFQQWMKQCELNVTHAAAALGVSMPTIRKWRDCGAPPIARLATWAVVAQEL